jgi:Outer membrane receptor proteins, mostly Fe transport
LNVYNPDRSLQHNGRMVVSSDNHTVVDSRGLYLQDQIRLNDQWQLLAGVRFDQFEVETTNKVRNLSEKQDSNTTSPRLGVVYTPLARPLLLCVVEQDILARGRRLDRHYPRRAGQHQRHQPGADPAERDRGEERLAGRTPEHHLGHL